MAYTIENAVRSALGDCMNVQKNESVLIVTDDDTLDVGMALYKGAAEFSDNVQMTVMLPAKVDGEEPPDPVAKMMALYDVVLCPTKRSLTHTDARRNACKTGTRIATLPGITRDVFIRTLQADYHKIAKRTIEMAELLEKAKHAHITTDLGTDIEIPIQSFAAIASTGLVLEKGKGGNLPSGEAFMAPDEGKVSGRLVIDASIAGIGKLTRPIVIDIVDGSAVNFSGGEEADRFRKMLAEYGDDAFRVAELGVGSNDAAIITGNILEDEKVFGTIHIAFGNNIGMGGTNNVSIHCDGVVTKPNMWLDNKQIIKNGNWLI